MPCWCTAGPYYPHAYELVGACYDAHAAGRPGTHGHVKCSDPISGQARLADGGDWMHARMIDAWMHACCVRVIYCRGSMHAISREAVTVLAAACAYACAWGTGDLWGHYCESASRVCSFVLPEPAGWRRQGPHVSFKLYYRLSPIFFEAERLSPFARD
jgi:hypothetical protein